jgi:hypothetical protein
MDVDVSWHDRRTYLDGRSGQPLEKQPPKLGCEVGRSDQLVEDLEVSHREPAVPRQVASLEGGVTRVVDLVAVDAHEVEDLVLVVGDAVEREDETSRPDERARRLDLETDLFGHLSQGSVLRSLTRIDTAAWRVPHGRAGSLRIATTEKQHAVVGVDAPANGAGRLTSAQRSIGQTTATVRPWTFARGTNFCRPFWQRESSETARWSPITHR